jgi:hypothetical protein
MATVTLCKGLRECRHSSALTFSLWRVYTF